MLHYRDLSNEELSMLFIEKYPDLFFLVTDTNRETAIACIEIALPNESSTIRCEE
jgi:hypothetical protein